MKLWIDDVRPAPDGYVWAKSVEEAKLEILRAEQYQLMSHNEALLKLNSYDIKGYHKMLEMCRQREIELINIDHDAGEYAKYGGDYIKLLDWLEATGRNYPIRIHSMNIVGVENMRAIIKRNNWKEIF